MNNKVLVKITVLELDVSFDVFIPVNELVWKIKALIAKSVSDLINLPEFNGKSYVLMNKNTCKIYANNDIVIKTDIRNGTELLFISD